MNLEMKDLPTERSGRVRDQRIGRVVELVPPAQILDDLPLSAEQEDAVLKRRSEVADILDRRQSPLRSTRWCGLPRHPGICRNGVVQGGAASALRTTWEAVWP